VFHTYRKIFVIACLIFCLFSSAFAYSGGSGTAENPYQIAAVADWNDLMSDPNDWNKHFIMITDVNLQGITLTPVSDSTTKFTGVFDGNDHIIRNAVIDLNMPGASYIGLFGFVGSDGQVRNLGVEDVYSDGYGSIGGLAGGNDGTIIACYVTGIVSGVLDNGGLVGVNHGTITNCYATSAVNGGLYRGCGGLVGNNSSGAIANCYATGAVTGYKGLGGLAGVNNAGTIVACYATGAVSGTSVIGGLVGENIGTVAQCYSTGQIYGDDGFVGGLVGYSSGTTTASFWDVNTSGQTTSAGGTGKTTAEMQNINTFIFARWDISYTEGDNADWFMQIDEYPILTWQISPGYFGKYSGGTGEPNDPYKIGTVFDWVELMSEPNDWDKHFILVNDLNLQGITPVPVGFSDGINAVSFAGIFNGNNHVINNVNIYMPDSNYIGLFGFLGSGGQILNLGVENVNINAKSRVGGLVALIGSPGGNTVRNCYTTGMVTGYSYVGGLAGRSYGGNITACYSKCAVDGTNDYIGGLVGRQWEAGGVITSSYATGAVDGNDYVGGLVGYNYSSISNCYSTGDVSGTSSVGGLTGVNSQGNIMNCYSTGAADGNESVGGLVGHNYKGSILNCYSTGAVDGNGFVGGLIGYIFSGNITVPERLVETFIILLLLAVWPE
jgi:hypothetical protein